MPPTAAGGRVIWLTCLEDAILDDVEGASHWFQRVVNELGRMHDVENVFVADGSVFVSAGGFNPTLTIMALALRTAAHITGDDEPQHER